MLAIILTATGIFLEAESFDNVGGWVTDSASVRQMDSAYLMAHGYGRPVADATTTVDVSDAGVYSVWVRTRNWNAEWTKGAAGRFQVRVGDFVSKELGCGGREWVWENIGEAKLDKGAVSVSLSLSVTSAVSVTVCVAVSCGLETETLYEHPCSIQRRMAVNTITDLTVLLFTIALPV